MTGIYKITNPEGKFYIGQSKDIQKRFKQHKSSSSNFNTKLAKSLKKYGHENHIFEIIEECVFVVLNERERYWQDYYTSSKKGLNGNLVKPTPNIVISRTGRKEVDPLNLKVKFTFWIEEKYLKGQNKDELRLVAYESIKKHIEYQKEKTIA